MSTPDKPARAPGAGKAARTRLGEMLVASGAITQEQLQQALAQQPRLKQPLGKVLCQLNLVTDEAMRQALSRQLGIPFIDLERTSIDSSLAKVITRSYANRRMLVPVTKLGETLTVAMDDPTSAQVVEELRRLTGYSVSVVTSTSQAIQRAFARLYDTSSESAAAGSAGASSASSTVTAVPRGPTEPVGGSAGADEAGGRRADELVNQILFRGLEVRCSDIHIEMLSSGLHVRFRIDGVLRQPKFGALQKTFDASMREIVSRIKILAKLDIAERRRPQDGSFRVTVERQGKKVAIDLRVSVVPSYSGESVVIRILDRTRAPRSIDQLDLSPIVSAKLRELLTRTTGIFLVTGPTGSGKSTTVYACLMHVHKPEIRILTAEDPVEYVYEELSQSEVNDSIGNTFAAFLRVFLRHDPEVIMVGEIRDQETAEMAFRAAQTGHLLISTLHTNSALAALPRLLDLNIESGLIASSLISVLSQRLARRICENCKREATPTPEEIAAFFSEVPPGFKFYAGAGCATCNQTGYKGRMMIADLWVPDEHDFALIARGAAFDEVRRSAERTTISMAADAHDRLVAGRTTLEELMRVLPYSALAEHRARFSAV